METIIYVIVGILGLIIGSFLNVLIYRIPKKENFVSTRSHCMNCDYQLKWYDLVPVFSYLLLGGKCRKCKTKISVQYPVIECLNAVLWVIVFLCLGIGIHSVLCCITVSMLLTLSVIDFRTYEIPFGINVVIGICGLADTIVDRGNWLEHVIGMVGVSFFLFLIVYISKGAAMGGGDVKLMAAAGLLIGWQNSILALIIGCVAGSVIHIVRMKVSKAEHVLAMGPYLSFGILITILFGKQMIDYYLTLVL